MAAQVAPPMTENDMITMIVNTLPVFYYEKMVGYTPSSFADLVFVGERIEVGLKRGKFDYPALINKRPKANGERPRTPNHPQRPPLNQPQGPPSAHPIPNTTLNTNQNTSWGRNFPEKKTVEFTPILVLYADLLPYLLDNVMAFITPAKIPQPPFFQGYNSNAICAYHGGVLGHSIEHCTTLKHKVQSLIDAGWLKFEENRS
ncbi:hypothetical protein GmHk_10G029054 [Glycine max]|nr:hypothetical protein GmHk_10G029054 [Glycine max]